MSVKRILTILILCLPLALWIGCSDDEDDSNPTGPGGGGDTGTTGTVSGVVSTADGTVLGTVGVTVADDQAQTNEQGYFSLSGVTAGDHLVSFTLPGYVTGHQTVTVIAGQTTHLPDVRLMDVESGTVAADAGGSVQAAGGAATVTFPADAFVQADGTPYSGDVNVEVAAMQPGDEGFYGVFPGDFEGQRTDGSTVPFVSYGFMDVNLTNADKSAPLQLADGVDAELTMMVDAAKLASAPATIPMWYFDPATGTWIEEGEATLEGSTYVASVEHFTTWNWDLPLEDVCQITGLVRDLEGNPVDQARVLSQGLDTAIMDEVYTDAAGRFSVRGIVDENFQVTAIKGSYASAPVSAFLDACPFALTDTLELLEPAFSVKLEWGELPSDLDSHLLIPATWDPDNTTYELYFGNEGSLSSDPYTELDTDDTDSFGPEIISGFRFYQGTYTYFVHNWSGQDAHPLVDSGAVVTLEIAGQSHVYRVANATGPQDAEYWHVFDFTVGGAGEITVSDVMTLNAEDPAVTEKGLVRELPAKR